jgi:phosphoribosyl 1,2-cyclic phosphodiesterase
MPAQALITFFGTAAANAFPEAFCSCRNCAQARMLGGKSLRKRSAALINDDLLIDLGPDIMVASQIHGKSLHQVRYCLQTHPHADQPRTWDGAMLYAIEANGATIFYGTDTAALFEQTWRVFRERKMRFDVVILDHTYGPEQLGSDHLSAIQVAEHTERMRMEGVLDGQARVFATHIAHEGNPPHDDPPHDDLDAFAWECGYEVAYDGLVIEI